MTRAQLQAALRARAHGWCYAGPDADDQGALFYPPPQCRRCAVLLIIDQSGRVSTRRATP